MGVWIETYYLRLTVIRLGVTPCMGVWIETQLFNITQQSLRRHTLYGCVD